MSSVPAIDMGWLATMPDRSAADGGERRDEVRCPVRPQLEQVAVVDDAPGDVAHVVGAGGRGGDAGARLGRRPVDGVVRPPPGRLLVDDGREVGEQVEQRVPGRLGVGDDQRRQPRARCAWMPAPPSSIASSGLAREGLDHARPADEGVGVLRHHHVVGQAEEEGRAGHDGPGGGDQHRDPARAAGQHAGGGAPAVQGRHAVVHVGAARGDGGEQGQAGGQRVLGRLGEGVAVGLGQRAPPVLVRDVDQHDVPAGHRGDLGGQRPRMVGRNGDGRGHVGAATRACRPTVTSRPGGRRGSPRRRGDHRRDRVAERAGGRRQQTALAAGQPDRAPLEAVDRHVAPAALQPGRRGGGRARWRRRTPRRRGWR